ncbi:hypothetical protein Taro_012035, partial [Colocasia esculenta]|nr:hypothetical protein [Colocasia esculenta]
MASRGRRGGASAREDEPRRDEQVEQQAPAPRGPVLPPPPPVDYGVFMQGLVQAMQTQAHTQAALQAQLEAQSQKFRKQGSSPIGELSLTALRAILSPCEWERGLPICLNPDLPSPTLSSPFCKRETRGENPSSELRKNPHFAPKDLTL